MIRVEQLNKHFGNTQVLHNINMTIDAGDRIALIGSNGAGKTTLMRCLLGEYCYTGSIRINDLEVREHRTQILRRVGFVPQLPPPLKMSVGQLLQFASGVCGSEHENINDISHRLGFDPTSRTHQSFNKLSGGQKQKLLISIALGRNLDLLILDEPAANLDPQARRVLFDLLAERQSDLSILLSSHRLNEVAALVNRVIELDIGRAMLDDHVAAGEQINIDVQCNLILSVADPAFAKTIAEWGFIESPNLTWHGTIAAAERLRFLGMLAHYAPLLKNIHLTDSD